jgi:hypothetical protein
MFYPIVQYLLNFSESEENTYKIIHQFSELVNTFKSKKELLDSEDSTFRYLVASQGIK